MVKIINQMKKLKVYIIQEIIDGLAECPILFIDEKKADKFFVKLVNEVHGTEFKDALSAQESLHDELSEDTHEIKYWEDTITF